MWVSAVEPAPESGRLWHDRSPRPIHYGRWSRGSEGDLDRIWTWVQEATAGC